MSKVAYKDWVDFFSSTAVRRWIDENELSDFEKRIIKEAIKASKRTPLDEEAMNQAIIIVTKEPQERKKLFNGDDADIQMASMQFDLAMDHLKHRKDDSDEKKAKQKKIIKWLLIGFGAIIVVQILFFMR